VDLGLIQELVAEYYRITVADLIGRRRTQDVVLPRQVGMFLAHELTEETLEAVAKSFGKKDHTTAIHALAKVRAMVGKNPDLDTALRVLRKRLKSVGEEG
jgi:chromosomal replication initiator protein